MQYKNKQGHSKGTRIIFRENSFIATRNYNVPSVAIKILPFPYVPLAQISLPFIATIVNLPLVGLVGGSSMSAMGDKNGIAIKMWRQILVALACQPKAIDVMVVNGKDI